MSTLVDADRWDPDQPDEPGQPAELPIGALRRSLARKLREAREAARMSRAAVERRGGGSQSKLTRIENGTSIPRRADVEFLARLYKLPEETVNALSEMAVKARQQTWWEVLGKGLPSEENFEIYLSFESFARSLQVVGGLVVPGIAQSEEYMRHRLAEVPEPLGQDVIDRTVQIRMRRQEEILGRIPVTVVIPEEALHREHGGSGGVQRQIAYLCELNSRHATDIRCLPYSAGPYQGGFGEFTILEFPGHTGERPVVYTETYFGGQYSASDEVLGGIKQRFAAIASRSVPIEEFAA
ncbi:helix-turn-helix domain-containing protein [Kineosporia sp. J2-2]|uniref:Helix-turn-helix domain-containing protein n=1 Tax=Kineosporia corallincola TaxID=2835133 RepID=A0ABS5TKK4_9ACTN|nr:helix-turn-helix transcriptional regulator [Kineosporia corallincola]MBT0771633.1 helix-turn-helix domain-containing protein [Kineosporia corallincola]